MAQNSPLDAPSLRDRVSDIFQVPRPIKKLFDAVPVLTYPANELPERSPEVSKLPCLYIFSTEEDAKVGRPSYNPGCLKYQVSTFSLGLIISSSIAVAKQNNHPSLTLSNLTPTERAPLIFPLHFQTALRMAGFPHTVTPSSNHASPTGSLPFLLPPTSSPLLPAARLPITQEKILTHASKSGYVLRALPTSKRLDNNSRVEAYLAMIDGCIRPAWLHSLYLTPHNRHIVQRLYLEPTSSSWAVQKSIEHTLTTAVQEQLILGTPRGRIDVDDIYARAGLALESFATALAKDDDWWILGGDNDGRPTLVDAALFAYTHLLLDKNMGWKDKRLVRRVERFAPLRQHHDRIMREFYPDVEMEK